MLWMRYWPSSSIQTPASDRREVLGGVSVLRKARAVAEDAGHTATTSSVECALVIHSTPIPRAKRQPRNGTETPEDGEVCRALAAPPGRCGALTLRLKHGT